MPRESSESWGKTFEALRAEWGTLRSGTERQIGTWNARFSDLVSEEATLRAAGRWVHGRSDLLGVIERHRDELTHSRMLGWLLDPCGRHGFGVRVLTALLAHAGAPIPSAQALGRARVALEVPLLHRRLDIVVDGPGFSIVIENKVDADEELEQCKFYEAHASQAGRCFVFLTPDGRQPTDAQSFRPMTYRAVAGILRDALQNGQPDASGRSVAVHYLRTLEMEFP
jgi:hypothetical protein